MKQIAVHSKDNHTYWCESTDTMYIERLKHGQYQSKNWLFAQTLLQRKDICLDIGSNNGCNTIHYAKQFNHVYAFEPTPLAQELWQKTISDNDCRNTTLFKLALGETTKDIEMVIHDNNGGHNHIENLDKPRWTGKRWIPRNQNRVRKRRLVKAEMRPLDMMCIQGKGTINFIKIDVEGYEFFVLKGGETTILEHKPIIQLELVAKQCRKFGYWGEDMMEWIRRRDYRVLSKTRGWLDGEFRSYRNKFYHDGVHPVKDMEYFLIPKSKINQLPPGLKLT